MLTSAARKAPCIGALLRTRTTISSRVSAVSLKIPTRIAPRSRICRVKARVSTPAIPTTSDSIKACSSDPELRQLLGAGDGFRTTKPETHILSDS